MSTAAGHNAAINLDLKWLVIRREVAPDVGLLCKAIADSPVMDEIIGVLRCTVLFQVLW